MTKVEFVVGDVDFLPVIVVHDVEGSIFFHIRLDIREVLIRRGLCIYPY
jgi:hypothetical protein